MKKPEPRVIVFIIADSLRYDTCYPYIRKAMPYLYRHSTHFHQVRSSGCWTLPSHASMFTGRWLHEHGQNTQMRKAGHRYPMLADLLKDKGYYNLMITSNVVVTDIFGLNRGFDETRKIWRELDHQTLGVFLTLLGYVWRPRLRKRFVKSFVNNKMAEDIESLRAFFKSYASHMLALARQRLTELLQNRRRVFLFFNFYDFHFPYLSEDTFRFETRGIRNKYREFRSLMDIINNNHMKDLNYQPNLKMMQRIKDRQRQCFERVGPLIDEFSRWVRKMEPDSTIVFSSDHGENFGEEQWLYHFANVTEGGNRVPLLWSSPGEKGVAGVDTQVSLKDVFGSFLQEAGIRKPEAWHLKKTPERSTSIIESIWYDAKNKTIPEFKRNQFAFVAGDQKFVYRKQKWFYTPVNTDSPTRHLTSFDHSDPFSAAGLDTEKKTEVKTAWKNFVTFEKKIPR